MEASWRPLGPSWGNLGGLFGRLGTSGSRKGERAENIEKHTGKSMILASRGPLGIPLGGLLERLGGLLARLGAILSVLEHLGAIFRPLEALLERLRGLLELPWSVLEAFWRLRGGPGCVGELPPRPPLNGILEPRGGGRGRGTAKCFTRLFTPGKRGSADS